MSEPIDEDLPVVAIDDPDGDLSDTLREAQYLLLRYPDVAQSLFAGFVAEGRRYGATSRGGEWRKRLEGSELIAKARVVWEVSSMKMLEENSPRVLPSSYVEALVQAAGRDDIEALLGQLFDSGVDHASFDA